MVDGRLLEVGFLDEHFARSVEDALGRHETDVLESLDYPAVNLVLEFLKIYILLKRLLSVAIDVDDITGEHRRKLDVKTVLADGQRDLLGTQEHLGLALLLVKSD